MTENQTRPVLFRSLTGHGGRLAASIARALGMEAGAVRRIATVLRRGSVATVTVEDGIEGTPSAADRIASRAAATGR